MKESEGEREREIESERERVCVRERESERERLCEEVTRPDVKHKEWLRERRGRNPHRIHERSAAARILKIE